MRLVMPPKITGRDLNEYEWEYDWVFWGSASLLSSHTSSSVRVGGLVVVVGSCGGTDGGTQASPPSFLSSPFLVCCEWMLHEKPQASILLEVDLSLSVCPESYYYYYYYLPLLIHCHWPLLPLIYLTHINYPWLTLIHHNSPKLTLTHAME